MADTTTSNSIKLGRVAAIPWGQGLCYVVEGREIAVFRQRDGKLFAVENRCPHRQGPLSEGLVGGGKVICPLHSHQFDLTTGQGHEESECVRTFRVAETDGNLMLSVEVEGLR
ncbi:MAG TPA: nitrite reductase (NAD(P)H) small subunit [Terriglobia bacterium]|nr:nitrite reductase (NAD(P)H) small subunit [Terriglobia bacterium]